jgi:hypothetical protein
MAVEPLIAEPKSDSDQDVNFVWRDLLNDAQRTSIREKMIKAVTPSDHVTITIICGIETLLEERSERPKYAQLSPQEKRHQVLYDLQGLSPSELEDEILFSTTQFWTRELARRELKKSKTVIEGKPPNDPFIIE